MGKCYAPDIGGTWNCVHYGEHLKGNPCCAPNYHQCQWKKKPKKAGAEGETPK